ncbi:DUF2637 domain-containing protein [Actinomadura flavalba]|uniref:DUF2637 domain-containing protein n=1 Tax=Actinomadura flavalba TaxID=1120938 RepID=UPI00035CEFBB|nr:DUF2637 domain-containing protein [Actinomadura flavalba]
MNRFAGALVDSGPVLVLATIAAAGSFTHIRDTATDHGQHGWMAWAVAVCIDLTCVMAARERQRDKRTARGTGRTSWPTLVLTGGILLSLAANLAQAHPSAWGWITAATPAAAFLVAVSMLERRALHPADANVTGDGSTPVPPSFGRAASSPASSLGRPVQDDRPALDPAPHAEPSGRQDEPVPARPHAERPAERDTPAAPLLAFARRVAAEHHTTHGRPITRDALRARLGVSNQLASTLLRQLRDEPTT